MAMFGGIIPLQYHQLDFEQLTASGPGACTLSVLGCADTNARSIQEMHDYL